MTVKEKGFAYFVSPLGCHLIVPGLLKRSLIDVERPHWHAMTATRESILRQNSMLSFSGSLGISKIHFGFHGMPCAGFGFHATAPWPEPAASRRSGGARWGSGNIPRKQTKSKRKETSIEVIFGINYVLCPKGKGLPLCDSVTVWQGTPPVTRPADVATPGTLRRLLLRLWQSQSIATPTEICGKMWQVSY